MLASRFQQYGDLAGFLRHSTNFMATLLKARLDPSIMLRTLLPLLQRLSVVRIIQTSSTVLEMPSCIELFVQAHDPKSGPRLAVVFRASAKGFTCFVTRSLTPVGPPKCTELPSATMMLRLSCLCLRMYTFFGPRMACMHVRLCVCVCVHVKRPPP